MKVLIVHAHPEPRSFVGALRDVAVAELTRLGHEVRVSDLHAQEFRADSGRHDFLETADPAYLKPQREQLHASERRSFAPDVRAELEKLLWADAIIWTFPLWWFSLPAILKGWVDRVFVMGDVYGGGRVYATGTLKGRRAMLAFTTGGPAASYAPGGFNGDLNVLLYPIHHGMFRFTGMEVLPPFVVYGPARMSDEERAAALEAWRVRLRGLEDLAPLGPDCGVPAA
jgi:NAD(P)H dehydrogenase (quinone)